MVWRSKANSLGLVLLSGAMHVTSGAVELPRMFSDHGVLQQGEIVPVWGWGNPGETVSVEFGGQKVAGKADQNGEWRIELKDLTVNATGRAMSVTGDSSGKVEVADLLVGEVWMASGQSNMQRPLAGAEHGKEDAAAADYPAIRMFLAHQQPHSRNRNSRRWGSKQQARSVRFARSNKISPCNIQRHLHE